MFCGNRRGVERAEWFGMLPESQLFGAFRLALKATHGAPSRADCRLSSCLKTNVDIEQVRCYLLWPDSHTFSTVTLELLFFCSSGRTITLTCSFLTFRQRALSLLMIFSTTFPFSWTRSFTLIHGIRLWRHLSAWSFLLQVWWRGFRGVHFWILTVILNKVQIIIRKDNEIS